MPSRLRVIDDRIVFNTDRPYSAEGQVIVAWKKGARIAFVDVTRDVSGTLRSMGAELATAHIMALYDAGLYDGTLTKEEIDEAKTLVATIDDQS